MFEWVLKDKDQYVNQYEKTTFEVEAMYQNPYRCCDIRNCVCEHTTAPYCTQQINNLIAGECGNGYRCCGEECNTCNGVSCYDYLDANTCYHYTYDCDCQCLKNVENERCESYCSSCFNPTITYKYEPDDEMRYLRYLECTDNIGMVPDVCRQQLYEHVNITYHCGIDDITCVKEYLHHQIGDYIDGFYKRNNYQDIQFGKSVNYEIPAKYMASMIVSGLLGYGSFVIIIIYTIEHYIDQ